MGYIGNYARVCNDKFVLSLFEVGVKQYENKSCNVK